MVHTLVVRRKQITALDLAWPRTPVFFKPRSREIHMSMWLPGSIWPWAEHTYFGPFGPLSCCAGPTGLCDDLNCRSHLGESCCISEFCLCWVCLLPTPSLSIEQGFWCSRYCHWWWLSLTYSWCGTDHPVLCVMNADMLHFIDFNQAALVKRARRIKCQFIKNGWCSSMFFYLQCSFFDLQCTLIVAIMCNYGRFMKRISF